MILNLHHVSVPVNDLDSATRFYSEVLSFTQIERPISLPSDGVWLEGYGFQIHLIKDAHFCGKGLSNPALPDNRHFALRVRDIQQFRKYLVERDVMVGKVMQISADKHQFFFCDPSNNVIEITNY